MVIALIANMAAAMEKLPPSKPGHHDFAAARQHAGRKLQRAVGTDEIANRKQAAG